MIENVNIQLYTPSHKQNQIHKACLRDDIFFVVVCAGRLAGKSLALINQSIYWCLSDPDCMVYWVSPQSSQANKVYRTLLKEVGKTDLIKSNKGSPGDTEIIFKNNSIIKFRSAEQGDSLRGESNVKYLIIDEAAFVKEVTFNDILFPMLNVKGKKCLISSTPLGKNWFYNLYSKGVSGEKLYKSIKFTSYDNPYANLDVIRTAKNTFPDSVFSQEYLANFIDSSAIFENIDELSCISLQTFPNPNERYWASIDIAYKFDYTVFSVINERGEVVYYDRFKDLQTPDLKKRLISNITTWQPVKTVIEINNQGRVIYEDLKLDFNVHNLVPFDTNRETKPKIINNLISAFSSKKIKIPNDEYLREEFRGFTMQISRTGLPIFKASMGFKDDCVMSIAILYDCFLKSRYSGKYVFL